MKHRTIKLLLLGGIILCIIAVLSFAGCSNNLADNKDYLNEDFVTQSVSPDGNYHLEAYRTKPGATVDFSIKVYIVKNEKRQQIYNCYHESAVEINWTDNCTVKINNVSLDLSKGQSYDWQKQGEYHRKVWNVFEKKVNVF